MAHRQQSCIRHDIIKTYYFDAEKGLLSFVFMFDTVCLAGCEIWKRQEGVASRNGRFYPYTSLSDCLKRCLDTSSCIAVDVSLDACVVHTNINDTADTFSASSFTQYTLNRTCQSSTSATTTATSTTKSFPQTSGNVVGLDWAVFYAPPT